MEIRLILIISAMTPLVEEVCIHEPNPVRVRNLDTEIFSLR